MQQFVHYFLHLVFPGIVARLFFPKDWLRVWLLFLATMLVDLDHLLATPIYDPNRCSIGFHLLHSRTAIVAYSLALIFVPNRIVRIVMLGLLMHMAADAVDCLWMKSIL